MTNQAEAPKASDTRVDGHRRTSGPACECGITEPCHKRQEILRARVATQKARITELENQGAEE